MRRCALSLALVLMAGSALAEDRSSCQPAATVLIRAERAGAQVAQVTDPLAVGGLSAFYNEQPPVSAEHHDLAYLVRQQGDVVTVLLGYGDQICHTISVPIRALEHEMKRILGERI